MSKNTLFILLSLFLTAGFFACQNDNNEAEEVEASLPLPPNNQIAPPAELDTIFKPINGVVRGFDWSATAGDIQAKETASPVEEADESKKVFTIDLNENEFADITYQFQGDSLASIQLDIYPADEAAAQRYAGNLKSFFNVKYKKRSELWEGSENGKIFTVFLTEKNSDAGPFVTVIWERESE